MNIKGYNNKSDRKDGIAKIHVKQKPYTHAENSLTKPLKMSELNKSECEIRQYKAKTTNRNLVTSLARMNGVLRGPKPESINAGDNSLLP